MLIKKTNMYSFWPIEEENMHFAHNWGKVNQKNITPEIKFNILSFIFLYFYSVKIRYEI